MARRSDGALRSMPASRRPRSISRRMPTLVTPRSSSRVKSTEAEMYGAPSKPCCRCTGNQAPERNPDVDVAEVVQAGSFDFHERILPADGPARLQRMAKRLAAETAGGRPR